MAARGHSNEVLRNKRSLTAGSPASPGKHIQPGYDDHATLLECQATCSERHIAHCRSSCNLSECNT